MKQFEIPALYKSPIISKVKSIRKVNDPRKKDFQPTILDFGKVRFFIARHFGFCYGVENAIEISYKAIQENEGKNIFLLSQMIHNPDVNEDLQGYGVKFLQDTGGNQLIPFENLKPDDVVIIPAFGTTIEIMEKLKSLNVDIQKYNTTCPFVEKVWNRSEKLGKTEHTIIIHGKHKHEETRATFSHSQSHAPSIVVKDIHESRILGAYILGEIGFETFEETFKGKYSSDFDPQQHLQKVGVVNQTTMLASETQEIADYFKQIIEVKYGVENIKSHFADTRDTLCYATNDNQSSTLSLLDVEADLAFVIGGYNSSNTTHLVEILETKFPTYFVKNDAEIINESIINHFDIHDKALKQTTDFLPNKDVLDIIVTSGASCPDAMVDKLLNKILSLLKIEKDINEVIENLANKNK